MDGARLQVFSHLPVNTCRLASSSASRGLRLGCALAPGLDFSSHVGTESRRGRAAAPPRMPAPDPP